MKQMHPFKLRRTSPMGAYESYGLTYQQIADQLGLTPQAVQAAEIRALRKLRDECARRGLRLEDLTESF